MRRYFKAVRFFGVLAIAAAVIGAALGWLIWPGSPSLPTYAWEDSAASTYRADVGLCSHDAINAIAERTKRNAAQAECDGRAEQHRLDQQAVLQATRSADAAVSAVWVSVWQARTTVLGLIFGLFTLGAAIAAAVFSKAAVDETRRGANAAQSSADAFVKAEDASLILRFPSGIAVTGTEAFYALKVQILNVGRSAALISAIRYHDDEPILMDLLVEPNGHRDLPGVHIYKYDDGPTLFDTMIEFSTSLRATSRMRFKASVLLDPTTNQPWGFITKTEMISGD